MKIHPDTWDDLQLCETQWHDGNVHRVEVQISQDEMQVTLEVDIYDEPQQAPDRHRLIVKLTKVREFAMVGTAAELLPNARAGHISSARLGGVWPRRSSKSQNKLRRVDLNVYLLGGFIRVSADAYEVATPRRLRRRRTRS